jgi:hypothetical protein
VTNSSLADWLQGWGTVAGSTFSAVAAITALALYWREISNRRLDLDDLLASQARNVLVTIYLPRNVSKLQKITQLQKIEVVANNFTDEVILNLYVRVHRLDTGAEVTRMASDVFRPRREWSKGKIKLDPIIYWDRPYAPQDLFLFNYWFTDARGQHWHRVDRQPPQRISNTPEIEWASYTFPRAETPLSGKE